MASEKNSSKEESTSSTSIATKGEHSGAPSVINTFANDGSFLELFKKRMEEESKKSKASEKSVSEDNVERKVKEDFEQNQTEGKVPGSTKILAQQVWFSAKKNAYIFPFAGKDWTCSVTKKNSSQVYNLVDVLFFQLLNFQCKHSLMALFKEKKKA